VVPCFSMKTFMVPCFSMKTFVVPCFSMKTFVVPCFSMKTFMVPCFWLLVCRWRFNFVFADKYISYRKVNLLITDQSATAND
jgi:hypothetical protein